MVYSVKKREDLENLNELVSIQKQAKEVRIEDKLGKQNLYGNMKKVSEPVTETIKITSEDLTKTIMLTSKENNKALDNLNDKLLDKMNDRGIIAS